MPISELGTARASSGIDLKIPSGGLYQTPEESLYICIIVSVFSSELYVQAIMVIPISSKCSIWASDASVVWMLVYIVVFIAVLLKINIYLTYLLSI